MTGISQELIKKTRPWVTGLPGRLLYGIDRSTPSAYFRALPQAGIDHLGVTSVVHARKVRRLAPSANLILTVNDPTAAVFAKAYNELNIRAFRISRLDELILLRNGVGNVDDLTIIVHAAALKKAHDLSGKVAHELATLLIAARSAADTLGLGYDVGKRPMLLDDHHSRIEELRHLIISAAVTVELIDICGGKATKPKGRGGPGLEALFRAIESKFEGLPISYSAELWLQPDASYFDQELLQEWRDEISDQPYRKRQAETYFISYANKQEPLAREVLSVVESRGHGAIVQFRDFAQTSFVRSMREGIERADRFIALQSKQYWSSDHCQAEWDAAYARDPGGKKRFIVPFLVEPAPLPPIASELIYKSLIGLNKSERRAAIGDWIDYTPQPRSRSQLRQALAKQASPDVRMNEARLDAGPNARFDRPLVDEDLAELPSNLRAIVDALLNSLPGNTPPVVRSCLGGYRQHLVERGTQPILGTVVPFAEAIKAQSTADAGQWDVGLETLFEHFFRRHQLLIAHFPLNPERELLFRETMVDEVRASGTHITEPVGLVGKAVAQLREAGLTTEDFDDAEQAHYEFSHDVASLPMPSETDSDSVTPKRRYVLGTIGFYERMLTALGGLASIAGISMLPSVQAAIASAIVALRSAIEALLRFIV